MVTQDKFFDYFDTVSGVNESEPWRPWTLDGKQRMVRADIIGHARINM